MNAATADLRVTTDDKAERWRIFSIGNPKRSSHPIEDWSKPRPIQLEILVPAESAAAQNLLTKAKVRRLTGVEDVIVFEMLRPVVSE
ncbi:hypothetical protein LTR37_011646 [Vermiconidia calcicola]|uniref:Uncharacterized protein n=1 Tax=Vermiconidia calcicola TaxID=1690605 RepID=A0ACC3N1E6_9PEZI|nr:hypothetical protein LTR37_011646 [Vermiconidia calcicola]